MNELNMGERREILTISDEVRNKAEEITKLCECTSNRWSQGFYISNYSIFGIDFEIRFYISYDEIPPREFSVVDINERVLVLYYYHYYPNQFTDTLMHELMYIYQYSKNRETLQNDRYYEIIKNVLDNREFYTSNDVMFAYALYISFELEQDAMIHGLYGYLRNRPNIRIGLYVLETEEYSFLNDTENALSVIDNDKTVFNEGLFEMDVDCYYERIKRGHERYKNKIEEMLKCVEQEFDEMNHSNESLVHANYHWRPVPYKHKY